MKLFYGEHPIWGIVKIPSDTLKDFKILYKDAKVYQRLEDIPQKKVNNEHS